MRVPVDILVFKTPEGYRIESSRIFFKPYTAEVAMFTTDGVDAADRIVPDSDYKDRWQNRRVALFVESENR